MKLNFNGIFPDFNQEFEDKKSELRKMNKLIVNLKKYLKFRLKVEY